MRSNVHSLGAVRARRAGVLTGLIAGLSYVSLFSAATAQVRTISLANAKAASASGSAVGLIDMVVLADESGSGTAGIGPPPSGPAPGAQEPVEPAGPSNREPTSNELW